MKLTTSELRNLTLQKGKSEAIVFDDDLPGFGVRLREGGSRTFIFQYKIGQKNRRIALGKLSAVSIGKARDIAKKLYARVRLGDDPAGEKAETKAKAHHTFKAAADEFIEHKRKELRPRSFPDLERHLLKHAKVLHGLQIEKGRDRRYCGLPQYHRKDSR